MAPDGESRLLRADTPAIQRAAGLLGAGGLVAFPTETVYGLGANACDPAAVRRLFAVKGRPADNPLIVHIAAVEKVVDVAAELTPLAAKLAGRWWPGPLTLVLAARPDLPRETTGGLSTVGLRVPDHPVALALLEAAAVPVAAPSANRSGRPSPTTAAHVVADLGTAVDLVLDGGPASVGVESTVVDARGDAPVVLREGAISREDLDALVDPEHRHLGASPGTRYRHYSPDCKVELVARDDGPVRAAALTATGRAVGVISSVPAAAPAVQVGTFADAEDLARQLYGWLRDAEAAGLDVLVVEAVAEVGIGRAVMDRLRRAADR